MSSLKKYLAETSIWKTIYLNFRYLDFRSVIRFPILVSRRVRLKTTKGTVSINSPIRTAMIRLGFDSCGIFDARHSRSIWEIAGEITFSGLCALGNGFKLCVLEEGKLNFGNNFVMTAESQIVAQKEISFGNDCLVSWDVLIMDTDFHSILDKNNRHINQPKPIVIGDKVWIGCRNLILKGSEIPSGAIIAANSKVTGKLLQTNTVYGKEPLQVIKSDVTWIR